MICTEYHPVTNQMCRLEDQHPYHLAGYEDIMVWPNPEYRYSLDESRLESIKRMLSIAARARDADLPSSI